MKPITFLLLCVAAGIGSAVITWLFLTGLPAIVVGGIIFYIPGTWLDERVKSCGRKIDQLLPIGIGRTTTGLLAGGSVPDVFQQVGESLEIQKSNPPTPVFVLIALEMRIKDG
jgi:pilus assembly protein TadC